MNKLKCETWLAKLGKAWSERDPKAAASLFSRDCKYYESVLEEPCKSWDDILKLWLVVPENQKDVIFGFKVLAISDACCIANWQVTRTLLPSNKKQLIDGIFQISIDEQGLCDYFKQWTVKKI
ncbi:MAG: nuclear transport factor 2 family protein [Candidatus Aenigmarchaeota archaeon]|nr:nuclear transport factor 2 family protein [Candidatus Aenigmarchaeota archaeon]